MNPIQKISIPSPCHESWNEMLPAEGGRHCEHCCKTVVNFAAMTDNEIISYLASHKAVCGRFEAHQLNNLDRKLYVDNLSANNWWKRAVIILGMMGPLAFRAGGISKPLIVNAGDTTKTHEPGNFTLGKIVAMPRHVSNRIIKGRIIAKEDSLPIPGASITIKGTSTGTVTDVSGKFTTSVPADCQTLIVNEVGYNAQEIRLTDVPDQAYNVALVAHEYLTGEIVVATPYSRSHGLWARTKRFFKRLFKLFNKAMRPIKIIDIPDPCRQSWHDMKATAEGRYCSNCKKIVIDFTLMTNKEIITFLASGSNICGRLYSSQMESINTSVRSNKNSFLWKTLIAGISLISVFNQVKAESKIIPAVEQGANSDIHKRPTHKTLHGRCLTSAQIHDELPIRQLPHQGEDNVLFSSQTEILGGVVRCIAIVQRPPLYKRIWWQIKKVF